MASDIDQEAKLHTETSQVIADLGRKLQSLYMQKYLGLLKISREILIIHFASNIKFQPITEKNH